MNSVLHHEYSLATFFNSGDAAANYLLLDHEYSSAPYLCCGDVVANFAAGKNGILKFLG